MIHRKLDGGWCDGGEGMPEGLFSFSDEYVIQKKVTAVTPP